MSRIKLITPIVIASITASTHSQLVFAGDSLTIIPQIAIQKKSLDFHQRLREQGKDDVLQGGFEADVPTVSTSLTLVYDRLFTSVKYETSYADAFTQNTTPFTNGISDISRSDLNVTFGMNVVAGLNAFVGYISGQTQIRPTPEFLDAVFVRETETGSELVVADNSSCASQNACNAAVTSNLAKDHQLNNISPYRQDYREEGWFLGASYGMGIQDAGTLSTSIAYAFMKGNYTDNYFLDTRDDLYFHYKGDSRGLSLALTWSAPFTQNTGYYVDLRRQMYDMKTDVDASGNFGGSVETDEDMTTITLGVQFYL